MDSEDASSSHRTRRLIWVFIAAPIVIGVVALVAAGLYFNIVDRSGPAQPMPFPHVTMVQAGIPCLYCHADAIRSPAAGMPSVQKCMGCHQTIAKDTAPIKQLTGYWERQEPIPWARVYNLPRFMYFSHEAHVVGAGLNCERCHGDVGHMREAQPVVHMNMGWCLHCHLEQPNAPQLRECLVCHK